MMALPPRESGSGAAASSRCDARSKIRGIVRPGHVLVAGQHVAASFQRDVADRRLPALAGVSRRRQVELDPPVVERGPRQGHVVLPADEPADAAQLGRRRTQPFTISFAPDQALAGGWLQLAVVVEQFAVRTPEKKRAVEGAGGDLIPLDEADGKIDLQVSGRLRQQIGFRPWHADRVLGVAAEEGTAGGAAAADDGAEAQASRIAGDECFREEDQPRPMIGGLPRQRDGLVQRRVAIEKHRGVLDNGDGKRRPTLR